MNYKLQYDDEEGNVKIETLDSQSVPRVGEYVYLDQKIFVVTAVGHDYHRIEIDTNKKIIISGITVFAKFAESHPYTIYVGHLEI